MTNGLVVFIHGLGGDAVNTWAKFPALLGADTGVASRYANFASFEYDTGIVVATRPLSDIASELANFINEKILSLKVDEVVFITHSQGGNLARRYLCNLLLGEKSEGMPIFRLLAFAEPYWSAYSKYASWFVPRSWEQVKGLAFDSDPIHALNKEWALSDADERINVLRVIAGDDAIVPEFSSLGANYKNKYRKVPKYGHIDIVKVNDVSHPSFQIAKEFLLEPSSYQPALVNPDRTPPVLTCWCDEGEVHGNNRFIYTTRYVKFFGREKEKTQLMTFLLSPAKENVAWMWVKGQGGVGKSRLALELCLIAQADWHAGFLNLDADAPDWARWQPQLPTLMIVDYATTDIDKLGRLLRGLCNRDTQSYLRRPVRILLLDRPKQEDRLAQAIGHDSKSMRIKDCHQDDLELVKTENPWAIIEDFLTRANFPIPDKKQTLGQLIRIDPEQRPLFAILLADALCQKVDIGSITRESFLENVLAREREKYWRPAAKEHQANLEKHEYLLALATIGNGLVLLDAEVSVPVLKVMTGYDQKLNAITPLAPDLIGECFTLQILNSLSMQNSYETLSRAWSERPGSTNDFFNRVTQDFPLDAMLDFTLEVRPTSREGRHAWSYWVTNFVTRTGEKFSGRAVRALKLLKLMAEKHLDEPEIRLEQAKATANLMCFSNLIDSAINNEIYANLRGLVSAYPNEPEIRLKQAQAAFNWLNHVTISDPNKSKEIFAELCVLSAAHPDEPEIRSLRVRAAVNRINYLIAIDPVTTLQVYTDLCALARAHTNELLEVGITKVEATINLKRHLSKLDPSNTNVALRDLHLLVAANFGETERQMEFGHMQALAAFGMLRIPPQ